MASDHVLKAAGKAMGLYRPENWGPLPMAGVAAAGDAFEAAMAPGSVRALRAKPKELDARVAAYLSKKSLSADAVIEHVMATFDAAAPAGGATHEHHLRGRFEKFVRGALPRFRTYDDDKLTSVVGNFRDWDRHVEYMQGLKPGDPELEKWLVEFGRKVVAYLKVRLRLEPEDAEDAFHTAVLEEIKRFWVDGYVYEGPLDGWLKNAAYNRGLAILHALHQGVQAGPQGPVFFPGIRASESPDPAEVLDAFELVRSLTDNPATVNAEWEALCEGLPPIDAGARFRLLSRILAVLFLRKNPDATDQELIDYLTHHRRYHANQGGTVRKLAALVRAARGESLLLAAFVHYVIGMARTVEDAAAAIPRLKGLPHYAQRILAAKIYHFGERIDAWNYLPGGPRGRWVAACWYVENWRNGWDAGGVAGRLQAPADDPDFLASYDSVKAPLIRALACRPAILGAATLHLLENGGNLGLTRLDYPDLPADFVKACRSYDFGPCAPLWRWKQRSGKDRECLAAAWILKNYLLEKSPPPDGSLHDFWGLV